MKTTIVLLALACSFTFSNCNKSSDSGASKETLLTGSSWKYNRGGFDANNDDFIDADFPPGYVDACRIDNTLTFKTGGQGTVDEGALKCDAGDPQTSNFTWTLASNGSSINFPTAVFGTLSGDVKLVKLTSTELIFSKIVTISGSTTANIVIELKH